MALPLLAGGLLAAGLIGSLSQKKPKYNKSAMDESFRLINEQYKNIENYFQEAGTAFEGQYAHQYGQEMQDSINQIAGSGIYESPVSQNIINRKQVALGDAYANAKSQLAGQKMSAIGQVDQQKAQYYMNLAGVQYQESQQKAASQQQLWGSLGSLGTALMMGGK